MGGWREVLDQPFQPRGSTDCTRCGNIFEKSGMENCVWEPYSDWSECSVSCGGGTKTRTRVAVTEVVKKLAEFGFRQCLDNGVYVDVEETETATCNDNSCPR